MLVYRKFKIFRILQACFANSTLLKIWRSLNLIPSSYLFFLKVFHLTQLILFSIWFCSHQNCFCFLSITSYIFFSGRKHCIAYVDRDVMIAFNNISFPTFTYLVMGVFAFCCWMDCTPGKWNQFFFFFVPKIYVQMGNRLSVTKNQFFF